jgi:hypothetical protein
MIPENFCRLACVLLLLCCACGDDDAATIDSPIGQRDGGGDDAGAPPEDDSSDDDEPAGAGAGSDRDAGSDSGSDPETDAATQPPGQTADAGSTPQPGDAAVAPDGAAPVTDCESLSACCEQLSGGRRRTCDSAIEMADDAACVEIARVACRGSADSGMPAAMPCEQVLECCAGLPERRQTACEAAAAAPAGRACERAVELYCP